MDQQNSDDAFESILDTFDLSKKEAIQYGMNALNILGVVVGIYALYWGYEHHIFTSEVALRNFLEVMGPTAPYIFILIQIVQTVIPIIPAALTLPMGILIFGSGYGFFLNFVGVMMGSVLNFYLARKFGRPLVEMLVSEKQYNKYIGWLDYNHRFDKLFTFGMFFPISPADFLCYLAGLSNISFKKFMLILSLGKPLTLFLYSYGTLELLNFTFQLFA